MASENSAQTDRNGGVVMCRSVFLLFFPIPGVSVAALLYQSHLNEDSPGKSCSWFPMSSLMLLLLFSAPSLSSAMAVCLHHDYSPKTRARARQSAGTGEEADQTQRALWRLEEELQRALWRPEYELQRSLSSGEGITTLSA